MSSEVGSKILQIVGACLAIDTVLYSKHVNLYQHGWQKRNFAINICSWKQNIQTIFLRNSIRVKNVSLSGSKYAATKGIHTRHRDQLAGEYTSSRTGPICRLTFRHRASSIQDRLFATLKRMLFIYLINKFISLSDICLTVHH